MDYKAALLEDLKRGFSKTELEKLIGLPQNNLSGILKGNRTLSTKSKLKIDKWMASAKPNPLEVFFQPKENKLKMKDLTKPTNKVEPNPPMGDKKSNFDIDTTNKKAEGVDQLHNADILKQIEAVKADKIPKERDTPIGRKVWSNDQWKKINELKSQLR